MKKIFLFAAALVAAMTATAAVWDIEANPANTSDLFNALNPVVTNAKATQKQTGDNPPKDYIEVTNTMESTEASVEFDHFPMKVSYTNSSKDKKFFRIYPSYFQVDAKGTKLTITCKVGDEIKFYTKSYTKGLVFFVTGADKSKIEFVKDAEDAVVSVKATATEVVFDSSIPTEEAENYPKDPWAQSYQFKKFEVVSAQGVENVSDASKAVKTFENGQLVIIKNGVKYNALGVAL